MIYKNKYTDAIGFDYFDFAQYKFAQPTDRSRLERIAKAKAPLTRSVSQRSRNSPTQVFSLSEITLTGDELQLGKTNTTPIKCLVDSFRGIKF
ncbi:hypothetical protein [Nostoc sp. DedQUE09]|uniref:hypothetical protein n=1 Tax=Nostoc sp. DedQUE09 TaxID=3075394 RepID=UPI002AD56AF0|nr:hypothetical protein [Nostoc sp. DedQUE09]MDZ7956025.1 hypothetical protein [Nostoc sp. DedQUE09]